MAEAEKVQQLKTGARPLETVVIGKVTRARRYEKFWYTTIICPAKDEYSRPSVVEIRSKARFADAEEKVNVHATVGGYEGKGYTATDRETGERRALIPVNIFLDLVED